MPAKGKPAQAMDQQGGGAGAVAIHQQQSIEAVDGEVASIAAAAPPAFVPGSARPAPSPAANTAPGAPDGSALQSMAFPPSTAASAQAGGVAQPAVGVPSEQQPTSAGVVPPSDDMLHSQRRLDRLAAYPVEMSYLGMVPGSSPALAFERFLQDTVRGVVQQLTSVVSDSSERWQATLVICRPGDLASLRNPVLAGTSGANLAAATTELGTKGALSRWQNHAPPRTVGGHPFDVHHLAEVHEALRTSQFFSDTELLLRLGARLASETPSADGGPPVAGSPAEIRRHYVIIRRLVWCE